MALKSPVLGWRFRQFVNLEQHIRKKTCNLL